MIQEPPPLPFPSLNRLKSPAKEILDNQRNPTTPEIEIKFFVGPPIQQCDETTTAKKKPNKKACDVCKRKKVKCDNNVGVDEYCTRTTCPCIYHVDNPHANEDTKQEVESSSSHSSIRATPSIQQQQQMDPDTIPSTTVFRKPGLLYSGHYAGETSFCGYLTPENQPSVISEEEVDDFPVLDLTHLEAPFISEQDQHYLIQIYYENLNPFFPIINHHDLISQLDIALNKKSVTKSGCYLSPLFFYALFARASALIGTPDYQALSEKLTDYVAALSNCYKDKPRISTVLAWVIMTNHLEQTKLPEKLTRSWLWAGEAFRLALDLGIHRSRISEENDHLGQLCIRTFWLAYITDCTISMTYGRPSATEEKVLDVTSPKRLPTDDHCTAEWLEGLNSLISLSKIAARVIKFNYCPPPPFEIQGPVKRHNAFLASVDSWLTDIMHPTPSEPDSPISSTANVIRESTLVSKRIAFLKKMFLYANLILLHRPHVNDIVATRNSTRPSYDICTFAAILITNAASQLDQVELNYHSKSPMIAYALVMALRVHIMNATESADKFNTEKNFMISVATLEKLPQSQNTSSLLYNALVDLKDQYHNRFLLAIEEHSEFKQEVMTPNPYETLSSYSASVADSKTHSGGRKREPTPTTLPTIPESSINMTLSMKHYKPPDQQSEKKKRKAKVSKSVEQKKKQKQKQIQHQHVFSTHVNNVAAGQQQAPTPSYSTIDQTTVMQQQEVLMNTQNFNQLWSILEQQPFSDNLEDLFNFNDIMFTPQFSFNFDTPAENPKLYSVTQEQNSGVSIKPANYNPNTL